MTENERVKAVEKIIIDSDLYQTFIEQNVDYSGTERKLALAIIAAIGVEIREENIELTAIKRIISHLDEFGYPIVPEFKLSPLAEKIFEYILEFYENQCFANKEKCRLYAEKPQPPKMELPRELVREDFCMSNDCTKVEKMVIVDTINIIIQYLKEHYEK